VLKALDITPDGIIGHSVGELGCAYADGCFTAEEMILAAYARGRASLETNVIPGMMAAIGNIHNIPPMYFKFIFYLKFLSRTWIQPNQRQTST